MHVALTFAQISDLLWKGEEIMEHVLVHRRHVYFDDNAEEAYVTTHTFFDYPEDDLSQNARPSRAPSAWQANRGSQATL